MIRDWFGTEELIDQWDLIRLLCRLAINLVFTWLVVSRVYARLYRENRDFIFTYYIINTITFTLCILLRKVPMEIGFAFGLFAVFGILRYRTEAIRMRDLTYLFIVIGIAILNAVANKKISLVELLVANIVIVGVTAVIALSSRNRVYLETPILYDNLGLLQPGREAELLADLSKRTGLTIVRVQVQSIDLLRDAANITAYYKAPAMPEAP